MATYRGLSNIDVGHEADVGRLKRNKINALANMANMSNLFSAARTRARNRPARCCAGFPMTSLFYVGQVGQVGQSHELNSKSGVQHRTITKSLLAMLDNRLRHAIHHPPLWVLPRPYPHARRGDPRISLVRHAPKPG